jgi:RNA polymerase sigma-70 factor (ECF subfamily)
MYPDELTLPKDDSAVVQGAILDQANTGIALTFDELFERFSSMVFGLVYQILGDREEAMDVSQEVFLTVYRKLDTFRGESSLKTWIYCIAVHKAANRFRWWNRLRRREPYRWKSIWQKARIRNFPGI